MLSIKQLTAEIAERLFPPGSELAIGLLRCDPG